jgi:hypothetical protein
VIDGVADFEVVNVQAYNGYVLHTGHLKYGTLSVGSQVVASYDEVSPTVFLVVGYFSTSSSSAGGPCEITTRRHTSSTTLCGKSWATISTRKVRWLLRPSFASTFHTRPKLLCRNSRKSSRSASTGSNATSRSSARI